LVCGGQRPLVAISGTSPGWNDLTLLDVDPTVVGIACEVSGRLRPACRLAS